MMKWSSMRSKGWFLKTGNPEIISMRARNGWPMSPSRGLLQGADGRLPAPVLVDKIRNAGFLAGCNHVFGSGQVRRHRFLADHGNIIFGCQVHQRGMCIDLGDDIDEVDFFVPEQLFRVAVDMRYSRTWQRFSLLVRRCGYKRQPAPRRQPRSRQRFGNGTRSRSQRLRISDLTCLLLSRVTSKVTVNFKIPAG